MDNKAVKLIYRMILIVMAGDGNNERRRRRIWGLYEKFIREMRLHATVREILEAKKKKMIA